MVTVNFKIKFVCVLLVSCFACYSQTYFDITKEYPCKGCGNYTANLNALKKYNALELQQVFNSIYKTGIEFNFPQGGCQQRAQIMSMLLEQVYKIEHCKVWLFSPSDLYFKDNRKLIISDKNNLSKNNQIAWGYHVAPVVLVEQDNRVDTMVLDPSIKCSGPIVLRDWLKSIQNSDISKYTFLNSDRYFFNAQYDQSGNLTTVINGYFYEYDQASKDDLLVEKGLALNDMAMYMYKKHMKPLMDSATPTDQEKLNDLKAIFGNATVLDCLFSQNTSPKSKATTQRYAISHYPELIKEAKNVFNDRLIYWTTLTNKLIGN
jgi:hypothetical protein